MSLTPLAGMSVLEYSHTPAAAHAGKLLRQLGATVHVVADIDRGLIPDAARPGFDLGKTAWSGDTAAAYDVVLTDSRCLPGAPVRPDHPQGMVVVEIVGADAAADPDGLGGTSLGASAAGGVAIALGRPDRAPLGLPGGVVDAVAGTQAVAAVLALRLGAGTAKPSRVEISLNGAIEFFVGINATVFAGYPRQWLREGRRTAGSGGPYPAAIFPCKEGFVGIIGRTRENWHGILEAMGWPEWAGDERMRDPYYVGAHLADEVDPHLAAWTSTHTERELTELSLRHGFVVAPIRELREMLDEPQYQLRGFWEQCPDGSPAPGLPFVVHRPEPSATAAPRVASAPHDGDPSRLLDGIRVVDLSWVWAGPMATMMLADLGADVIKVEHPSRPDASRLRGRPSWDGVPVEGPEFEVAPYFQQLNHGKSSFGVDLRDPGAVDVLRSLIATADVVVENMRPGVLDRRGLGYADLARLNPGVVMLSMSLAGQTGPLSRMRGYAPVMSGLAGLERQIGYPPDDLTGMYTFSFADANASVYGVAAVLAALLERRAGGGGCWLDLSQVETTIATMPLQVAETVAGRLPDPYPNHDRRYPFQEVVRCVSEPDWLAVTATTPAAYQSLARFLGAEEAGVHAALTRWAATQDRDGAQRALRAVGVTAVAVRRWEEVVRARDASGPVHTAGIEPRYGRPAAVRVAPWLMDGRLPAARRRAPVLGEHTERILRELGLAGRPDVAELLRGGALFQAEG